MADEEQVQETAIKQPLPSNPTMDELFTYFDLDEAPVRVAPITIKEDPEDTRLLMLVRGEQGTASFIFAELYNRIVELSQLEQQQEANRGGSGIITP